MQSPYVLNVTFEAHEGKEGDLKKILTKLAEHSKKEPECLKYFLHQSSETDQKFFIYASYISKKAHQDHLAMPYVQEVQSALKNEILKDVEISTWNELPISKPSCLKEDLFVRI